MTPEVQEYLNALSPERRDAIDQVRAVIQTAIPNVVEDFQYRMPTFHQNGQVVAALASQKQYMALYIMPYDLLDVFKGELAAFNCGKSCIRFRKLKEGNLDLFGQIVAHAAKEYPNSQFYRRIPSKS